MQLANFFSLALLCCWCGWTAGAPTKLCGAKAGKDCPKDFCVSVSGPISGGKCVKRGGAVHWSAMSTEYPKPTDTKNKNCGSAAGTNCPNFVCVDKKHAKGECTQKNGMWTWKSGTTNVAPKPPANSADKNCGAKAGTNCPPQMCVSKSYGGKGSCREVSPGKWRWNSGPLPA